MYDWMTDIKISINKNINWIKNKIIINFIVKLNLIILIKVKIKCPVIILAVNRIVRVKGLIINLIVSIQIIKGINIKGVFWGIIFLNIKVV